MESTHKEIEGLEQEVDQLMNRYAAKILGAQKRLEELSNILT